MKIVVTEEAFAWFKREMDVTTGDYIRFYARYGGSSPFHEGFSLGMNREHPHDIGIETIIDEIHFYIERDDTWFFDDHDLHVIVNTKYDEIAYEYKKS